MKTFGERNPVWIAVLGTLAMTLGVVGTFHADSLPVIGGGTTYTAHFRESAGLTTSSEVRVAGVKVGKVSDMSLDGDQVEVSFKVKDAWLGDRTTAAIKIKTLLGQKYLALDPEGERRLEPHDAIPLERTTVPYDVTAALSGLTDTVRQIDVEQVADGFRALSGAFEDTPQELRRMLRGMSGLASTIAERDDELASLMKNLEQVSGVMAGLDGELEDLLADGDLLLGELDARRTAMHRLLVGTRQLSRHLAGMIKENEKRLSPALAKLDRVSGILQRNRDHIDEALGLLGPYYTMLTDATGSGPWADGYLCGLFRGKRPELESGAERDCRPRTGGGR